MMRRTHRTTGMTLLELCVLVGTVAVLAILVAGLAMPIVSCGPGPAIYSARTQEALGIYKTMYVYATDHEGRFPAADDPSTPENDTPASAVEVFIRIYEMNYLPSYSHVAGNNNRWVSGKFTADNLGWALTRDTSISDNPMLPVIMGRDPNLTIVEVSETPRTEPQMVTLSPDGMFGTEGLVIVRNDGSASFVRAEDGAVPLVPQGYLGPAKRILNPDRP